jgi:hypothetical protein
LLSLFFINSYIPKYSHYKPISETNHTSNSPLAIVHQKSKYLRHIKQAKQTLQRKQSCIQEQSFALVTWFYRYGFVWMFFVLYCCPVVFNSSILNSSFAITPVVTGNGQTGAGLAPQDP